MSTATTALDPQQVRQWLNLLHGQTPGLTHICATGNWTGRTFDNLDAATTYVTQLDHEGREGIYARVTTLRTPLEPGRRGGAADTMALPALWADLDLAGPGHAEHNLPPDTAAGQQVIAISGLPQPTLWVHSGGGLYPLWLLDTPALVDERSLDTLKTLSANWQRVIEHAAGLLGWAYGRGVGDLSRVLRIPGTINRKAGVTRPCRILEHAGPRHTLEQLQAAADRGLAAIPAPSPAPATPASTPRAGPARERDGDEPGQDFNERGDWATILSGWTLHNAVDGIGQWTRPGKDAGISATTNALGTDRLHVFSTNATPFVAGESYHKFAAYTLLRHGGDFRAAARDLASQGYGATLPPLAELQQADMDIILPGWRDHVTPPAEATGSTGGPASRYFTDSGSLLAQLLARDVLALGPLAVGGDDILWSYRHGVWTADRHAVRNRLTRLLGDRYRRTHAAHIEDIVRADCPTIGCDPIPNLINFRNGLLDWSTGHLRPHDPEVLSTVQLGVEWNPQATCGRFDQFLHEVVPTDVVPVMWELIGYLMMSGNPLHKAIMLMGTGRNGKGTFLRAIVALLGKQHVSAVSLQDLTSTRFSTVTLYGKIANIAGDIDATYLESTAIFKAITGQDQISAEHKGRDRFDFTPWAVPVFSANEIPPSADTSTGYLSRWLPIPFPHSFAGKEDRTLDTQLAAELPGIAVRAIGSLRDLMARGEFDHPPSITGALDEFSRRVDQVRSWLSDCCEPIPPLPHDPTTHAFVSRTTIYEAYRRWCARDGHRPLAAAKFYDRLGGAGASPAKVKGERGFRGVSITDSATMLTQSPSGAWWPTSSDEKPIKGAGGGQVGGSVHNANLPPLNSGADLQQRLDDQDEGAGRAAFSNTLHTSRAYTHTRSARLGGVREKLPHLPPPAPLINCHVCGKPLDPVLAPRWQTEQLHPSCRPEESQR